MSTAYPVHVEGGSVAVMTLSGQVERSTTSTPRGSR